MTTRVSPAMIEALRVAYVQGQVCGGDRWEPGEHGHVKNVTITALVYNRGLLTSVAGEHTLTRAGYRALADAGVISRQRCNEELSQRQEFMDADHAYALTLDERRTITRAHLSIPQDVVLSWDEIDAAYQAYITRDWTAQDHAANDAAMDVRQDLPECGHEVFHERCADCEDHRYGESPQRLDIWLEQGVMLVSPLDGEIYRFERWTGGTAVLVNQDNGASVRVSQADVTQWQYLPKASAKGIADAKDARRLRVGNIVRHKIHGRTGRVSSVSQYGVVHVDTDDDSRGEMIGHTDSFMKLASPHYFVTPVEINQALERLKSSREAEDLRFIHTIMRERDDLRGELDRLRQRLSWVVGHWQTSSADGRIPADDVLNAMRDSR